MFVDEARIEIEAGKGGNGCCSFLREKYRPMGGPDGGSGGRGGSIYLEAAKNVYNLINYVKTRRFSAKNGENGGGSRMRGKDGADIILKVPVGTQVFDETGSYLIADLNEPGMKVLVAEGGKGGVGNAVFKSSTNRSPKSATMGDEGTAMRIKLTLKIFCDIGIVGKPNAGKSTLLSTITKARPKIANYEFTTLSPQLGVMKKENYDQITIGDIPGIIKDANIGKGLGLKFLKHIERCKAILFVISCEDDVEQTLEDLKREITLYDENLENITGMNPHLAQKPYLVAVSKHDLNTDFETPYIHFSSMSGHRTDELKDALYNFARNFVG